MSGNATRSRREGKPAGKLYPWDAWFGRGSVRLLAGRDYWCDTLSFAQQVRSAASVRGISVSLRSLPLGLQVTVKEDRCRR